MTSIEEITERLVRLAGDVPRAGEVLELTSLPAEQAVKRNQKLIKTYAKVTGIRLDVAKATRLGERTTYQGEDGGRAVTFHASGALVVRSGIAPLEDLFDGSPPDDALVKAVLTAAEPLRFASLVDPSQDALDFERLWKLKAAGGDRKGRRSEPVTTRAIGAFRHTVRGLPVLGRASAHVEVTGSGQVSGLSLSLRRFAGDGSGDVLAKTRIRGTEEAATDAVTRLVKALGGKLGDVEVDPQMFAFGYLSLGRRRAQSLLAPMFVAALAVDGGREQERSAHVIAVPGTPDKFLRLPSGVRPVATVRAA
ncbi:hypothetical protein [Cellulomonas composti]|uniref:Uncharacterized protein n=1 Tax=Cellulomonas composti TaxID=266130 RepID=A0A511J9X0_9CELL|nr:hypothetical protein [Cellulomonas composti]GEL94790.1 hypothetical protein CCO02nite_14480 [Cellulomonas composti]